MADSDLCFMAATEMARRLRSKELSARDVLDAHLRQIERVNPKVNAIVTVVAEQAKEKARQADEVFANGVALRILPLPSQHRSPRLAPRRT